MRRDFTINAMALSLNRGSRGLLVDPANGQADLLNKELRATNSYVFFDDPSRIFRLIRFQYGLGFELASRLRLQLENAMLEGYFEVASPTALACEIQALALETNVVPALEAYDSMGLLKLISPGLTGAKLNSAGLVKFEELLHTVLPPGTPGGSVAFLQVLLEKLTAKERAEAVKVFQLTKDEADALKQLDAQAKKLEAAIKAGTRPSHVFEALSGADTDSILMVLYSSAQRTVQDRIRAYFEKYMAQAQEITVEQVAATGVKPGTPKFDKAMKAMIATHLNARPRKVAPEDGEGQIAAVPEPAPVDVRPGRKQIVSNA